MICGIQIKLGRAALGWSLEDLANNAGLSWATIQRMEAVGTAPAPGYARNVERVQQALEERGIEFINGDGPGIRVKSPDA